MISKKQDKTSSQPVTSNDKELLSCLYNLSSICDDKGRKVDQEISHFKKMIKIGSSVPELQNQITNITKAITLAATLPENNKLLKIFKLMPADILIEEFIEHSPSATIKIKLYNYRSSLTSNPLAIDCIADLIKLFEATSEVKTTLKETSLNLDNSELQQLTRPLLNLFSQLDLSPEHDEDIAKIHKRSAGLENLNDLSLFLEEVSQIILNSIANSTGQFESFLVQLRQRLDIVNKCIVSNGETSQSISEVSSDFSQSMTTQVSDITTSLHEAENIVDLEKLISNSLKTITDGITLFDEDRKALEQQSAKMIADLQHELKQTHSETDYLKDTLQQQRNKALTDHLTQMPNRHAYNERLTLEYDRWRRYQKPLSLVIGDIDFFKGINDTHGHIAGDTALKDTAQIIKQSIRGTDFAARFGGEEFVILLPETILTEATKAINKIRILIQDNVIHEGTANFQLTMSFGVATFEEDDSFKIVLKRADKALYRAKEKGRNQVCVQRKNT